MERKDFFSIYELYFLLDAFDGKVLFGLPSREELIISSEQIWEEAREALIEKQVINDDNKFTEGGFLLVETLREYCEGSSLTIINNFYIMLSRDEDFSIVIIDDEDRYQVLRISQLNCLKMIYEKISQIRRKPQEDEKTFLKKKVEMTDSLEKAFLSDDLIAINYFPLKEMAKSDNAKNLMLQFICTETNGQLFLYDIKEDQPYRYSQYYFLERIFTWLGIPFKEEDIE